MTNLVPLHIYTDCSLGESMIKIDDLLEFAKKNDINALAITDKAVMYNVLNFYGKANTLSVRPLTGAEFEVRKNGKKVITVRIIAKNNIGYLSLVDLTTKAWKNKTSPYLTFRDFDKHGFGLFCIVDFEPNEDSGENIVKTVEWLKDIFKTNLYIGLEPREDDDYSQILYLSKRTGVEFVISSPVRYLEKEDSKTFEIYKRILRPTKKVYSDITGDFHLMSKAELRERLTSLDDITFEKGVLNSQKIAENSNFYMDTSGSPIKFEVPDGYNKITYLKKLVTEGLIKRYGVIDDVIFERAEYELNLIRKFGYETELLVYWDLVKYAKVNDIFIGYGRGTAPSSLLNYALGITDVDPVKNGFIFDRFLNSQMYAPLIDIDLDVEKGKRVELVKYLTEKYGENNVFAISTAFRLSAASSFSGVARALSIPYPTVKKYRNMFASSLYYRGNLSEVFESNQEIRKAYDKNRVIKNIDGEKIRFREWFDTAKKFENTILGTCLHAAGVLVCDNDSKRMLPSMKKHGFTASGYFSSDINEYIENFLKIDILEFNVLSVLKRNEIQIRKNDKSFSLRNIDLEDKEVYKDISERKVKDLFLFESGGMSDLLKRVKPDCFEDLVALVSLYRPGPLASGMVDEFIENKHKKNMIKNKILNEILSNTYGTIIYQEQIIEIIHKLGGYSYPGADRMRRSFNKGANVVMQNDRFLENCVKKGFSKKYAEGLLDKLKYCSNYCFNRSHAYVYALYSYQMAYLKHYYPEIFKKSVNNQKPQ